MKRSNKFKSLKRAVVAATAVVAVAGGGAFAVLQSQQNTLTGNTISTATANLQLSKDGRTYGSTQTGFDFIDIIPGGSAVPEAGHAFYLKNAGSTPLSLKLKVNSIPINPNNVDLTKVSVLLTTLGSATSPQSFSLQSLISGDQIVSGAAIGNNTIRDYKLQVSMAADALTGSGAALGNIDFTFTGFAQ